MSNLINNEDGFESIISKIEVSPNPLNKKVDQILFDRSGTIKRIQMKLNSAEERSLKKHADYYQDPGADFFMDILLEIENIDQLEREMKEKEWRTRQGELEEQQKKLVLDQEKHEKLNSELILSKSSVDHQNELISQLTEGNHTIESLIAQFKDLNKENESLWAVVADLKTQLQKKDKSGDKYKKIIDTQTKQLEQQIQEISQLEDENMEYKNKYFSQLDEIAHQ